MSGGKDAEEAWWQRGLAGDARAFGFLFDLHRDRVFRHAFRILQNQADAEDAAAVSFLELWRRRWHVRVVDGSVLPWLLVTTTNSCRNLDRSRRRYRRLLESLPHGESHPSAEDILLDLTPNADVMVALRELTPRDAHLFSLVAMEDYSVSDAARALGISPGAARTRLHRIRATLQRKLGHDTLVSYLTTEAT
ncbi:RNA polymerase sigma factor [Microbacterium sp. CPCC 204701]|uniref:RNA polymerase sigma factor n=1 Tax=Microbacterium sp. CPCC 204701 TaxID=2493084 RepID=UPI00406C2063